jgi:hypothetical protein
MTSGPPDESTSKIWVAVGVATGVEVGAGGTGVAVGAAPGHVLMEQYLRHLRPMQNLQHGPLGAAGGGAIIGAAGGEPGVVAEAVGDGVGILVAVGVKVGVRVGVGVWVRVGVGVGVEVNVGVRVGVAMWVAVGVAVRVGVGVATGVAEPHNAKAADTAPYAFAIEELATTVLRWACSVPVFMIVSFTC